MRPNCRCGRGGTVVNVIGENPSSVVAAAYDGFSRVTRSAKRK
jgi:hypothetical protein